MAAIVTRILGPNHNRLLLVPERRFESGGIVPGTATEETAATLLRAGWTEYRGPATAVGGWVTPDSDPALKARSTYQR